MWFDRDLHEVTEIGQCRLDRAQLTRNIKRRRRLRGSEQYLTVFIE
jgi:hypothetical protein